MNVWADIGGTFTDCLVSRQRQNGSRFDESIKVLSSGLVVADVVSVESRALVVSMPSNFVHDGFWNTADLATANGSYIGKIQACSVLDDRSPRRAPERSTVQLALASELNFVVSAGDRVTLDGDLEAPVLATRLLLGIPINRPLPSLDVRLGTTRGTNALLTRGGAKTALLITEGFGDLLAIGTQNRPDLFALEIVKPEPLPKTIIEVRERLAADGSVLETLDQSSLRNSLKQLIQSADRPEVISICFLHAYQNDSHEKAAQRIAKEVGFDRVVCSSDIAALPRIVPRAETTTLDAYLLPILEDYVDRVQRQFGGSESCHMRWMTSSGNLVSSRSFRGRESVLSGPAGGVVALGEIARTLGLHGAVGLDMGGTSTDVSRFDGEIGRRQESMIAGIRVLSPMMDIHTVAAGGGSICGVRDGRLFVGPESAGADPGPACYGRGGPLTITDINVILGRLPVDRFPFPLDSQAAVEALESIFKTLDPSIASSPESLAEGFLQIAVTEMAEAARVVTTAAGNDVRQMALVGFGGAAGGHLCRVAEALDMHHTVDHPQAGILSAVGVGNAPVGRLVTRSRVQEIAGPVEPESDRKIRLDITASIEQLFEELSQESVRLLAEEEAISATDLASERLEVSVVADLRYAGTQSTIELSIEPIATLAARMDAKHHETFGYDRPSMPIEMVAARAEAIIRSKQTQFVHQPTSVDEDATRETESGSCPVYDREALKSGTEIQGPAIISSPHSILVVEANWTASVNEANWIELHRQKTPEIIPKNDSSNDAVEMEIVARRVQGIAEAMGEVIRRTSVSVNVKERRDYSCAVFLGDGSLVANAPHVPVHLGAMGHCVRSLIEAFPSMQPGDCFVSNDPFSGGSHLPDVTVVTPVFVARSGMLEANSMPDFFVASRCHHAEIGGMVPGSMAPRATCLADEGVVLRNLPLIYRGKSNHDAVRNLFSSSKYPSRNVDENMADIAAAEAAGRDGTRALQSLAESMNADRLEQLLRRLLDVAGEATATWIESLGTGELGFKDSLDDGTPVGVRLIPDQESRRLTIDFTGTGAVHPNGFNATRSIVTAAVLYVLRCVTSNELPLCDGVLRRIELIIPPGLLDPPGDPDPEKCPAVVAGNVETSNRVVDVLLGALGVAAASQGTMNNLLIGDETFGYYETIGGGAGATANQPGADAVHTHMTNTRITDPEIFESRLPMRLVRFAIRHGSGGRGKHRGGDGMIREIEFLKPLQISMITSRRTTSPYGINGGLPGQSGQQFLIRGGVETKLDPSFSIEVQAGDRLRIETPGGGGFGGA